MGLEINLLSFIPLINDTNNLISTEASLKYFLTQALASLVLLFSTLIYILKFNFIFIIDRNMIDNSIYIIFSSLLIKTGAAPFHFWFPRIIEGISWINAFILITWQKIAPLILISYLVLINFFITVIIISILIGSLGGLNQTSLRKIIAFSSINHLGWIFSAILCRTTLWLLYFITYSFLSINLIYFFNLFKLFHLNQLFSLFFSSKSIKFSLFLNILSLGGLPPFLGFLPKWIVIQYLSINNQLFLIFWITIITLITLFFYMRIRYAAFILNYYENNWINQNYKNNFSINIYLINSFISINGLFIISLIFFGF